MVGSFVGLFIHCSILHLVLALLGLLVCFLICSLVCLFTYLDYVSLQEKMKGKNKLVPRLLGVTKESILRVDEKTKEVGTHIIKRCYMLFLLCYFSFP